MVVDAIGATLLSRGKFFMDDSEHLDEHGDVPAIELSTDPVAEIPADELTLLGEMMAWTSYIEVDLFLLFLLANPGDTIARRRQFYRRTAGLYARIKLVRLSFEGKLVGKLAQALEALLKEAEVLAQLRNEWAHNPIIRFGPKRSLMRWVVGSGDFAGGLMKVDAAKIRPHMPTLRQLHVNLTNVAALINDPEGKSYAIAFGGKSERMEAQIERYLKSVGARTE